METFDDFYTYNSYIISETRRKIKAAKLPSQIWRPIMVAVRGLLPRSFYTKLAGENFLFAPNDFQDSIFVREPLDSVLSIRGNLIADVQSLNVHGNILKFAIDCLDDATLLTIPEVCFIFGWKLPTQESKTAYVNLNKAGVKPTIGASIRGLRITAYSVTALHKIFNARRNLIYIPNIQALYPYMVGTYEHEDVLQWKENPQDRPRPFNR